MSTYKVVFHLYEFKRSQIALSYIHNLFDDLGMDQVDFELVLNGSGVKLMKKESRFKSFLNNIAKRGVTFAVCANSLDDLGIEEEELLDFAEIVSAGVSELVKKQNQGWAYVKP
ncbi:MAG: hypothetical protein GWO20_12345 [Candidatus Korarchaeota archaeon]|nr:hypothetical protein [Candidatus Korarchaeota archaeon]NIU84218.1 hypothetical protein [Candidatus Thorarchaeota archaeon]NIW14370.1 hypothetical protein [Candidatus Thorarchaeota archaeon]NIW52456.1 hypothetical protein [Candidatus Korarchaeota archaeon]